MASKIHKFLRITQPGDAKTFCGRETTIHATAHDSEQVTCRACHAVIRRMAAEKAEWDYETQCLGHESYFGPAGIAFYCDGSCRL